jgi:hypothetical protein
MLEFNRISDPRVPILWAFDCAMPTKVLSHPHFAITDGDMTMKKLLVLAFLSASLLSLAGMAHAAPPKTYQVTGPVLEVRDDVIVVQKGKEKWEIARAADTKIKGDLKVGAKVTIEYRMSAATVEAKDDGKAKDDAKAKK